MDADFKVTKATALKPREPFSPRPTNELFIAPNRSITDRISVAASDQYETSFHHRVLILPSPFRSPVLQQRRRYVVVYDMTGSIYVTD